jgi:hypothetical protein
MHDASVTAPLPEVPSPSRFRGLTILE